MKQVEEQTKLETFLRFAIQRIELLWFRFLFYGLTQS